MIGLSFPAIVGSPLTEKLGVEANHFHEDYCISSYFLLKMANEIPKTMKALAQEENVGLRDDSSVSGLPVNRSPTRGKGLRSEMYPYQLLNRMMS